MRWLILRQHRIEFVVCIGILLLCFLVFSQAFQALEHAYFLNGTPAVDALLGDLTIPLFLPLGSLPLLLGMFVGVPLIAREFEQGTYRLAWTQGITREQWFVSKTLWLIAAVLVVFGALTAALLRWNQVVNASVGPWKTFDANGVVNIFYALFGLTLGVALGTLIRKTVPAMALIIPVFIVMRLILIGLRGYYLPPQTLIWDYSGANPVDTLEQAWTLESTKLDPPGQEFSFSEPCPPPSFQFDPPDTAVFDQWFDCLHRHGFSVMAKYQPLERFWLFQIIESSIFLMLSASSWGFAFWWIKKKIA